MRAHIKESQRAIGMPGRPARFRITHISEQGNDVILFGKNGIDTGSCGVRGRSHRGTSVLRIDSNLSHRGTNKSYGDFAATIARKFTHMSMMDWGYLTTFLAVARVGRLTHAARNLRTDHTTISRRITALETALQTRLFDRSPAGYSLTDQGARLQAIAEQMETLATVARDTIGGTARELEGMVRVAVPEGFASYFLAPRLTQLSNRHPGLTMQLLAGANNFSLSKREADIVIALRRPTEGRLVARKLIDYDLALFASRSYLESHGSVASKADLSAHRFVGYIGDLIQMPELDYLEHFNAGTVPRLESSNLLVQVKAVLAGAGLCVLPAFIARCEPELVPVLANEIRLTRTYWMISHADHKDLARIKVTSRFIADQVQSARTLFRLPEVT